VNTFKPCPENLFFSKNNPADIRLGELFKSISINELNQIHKLNQKTTDHESFCILGYPDDEGIALNGGRIGAAAAPNTIRQYLYKMTPALSQNQFFDIGNLNLEATDLTLRHQRAEESLYQLQKNKIKTISLGGGHDYGYPDASAFIKAHQNSKTKPLVLNFDAHLDVRPTTSGYNSGTAFYRLLNEYENQFDFAEIGIQPQCNSVNHREWALSKKAHIFNLKDIQSGEGLLSLFDHMLFSTLKKSTPVFISFDIDGLTSTEAPGCSQSWVTGLKTENFLNFMTTLSKRCDIKGLGIYEVSPPLDLNNQTSKTAALIAYYYLFLGFL